MNRHVFAIMAHDQFEVAEHLLRLLDHPQSASVIHLNVENLPAVIDGYPTLSTANIIKRTPVQWGTYSLLRVQLRLLRAALDEGADYVHLLSGKDLPLRPVSRIFEEIEKCRGVEYIEVKPDWCTRKSKARVSKYYSEKLLLGKNLEGVQGVLLRASQQASLAAQGLVGVNRSSSWDMPVRSGSTWFSVTAGLAKFFVDHADWADWHLRHTFVPEEFFFASMASWSPMAENICQGSPNQEANLRQIKWQTENNGHPHVWTRADLPELQSSDNMFARKFDQQIDSDIISSVVEMASGGTAFVPD